MFYAKLYKKVSSKRNQYYSQVQRAELHNSEKTGCYGGSQTTAKEKDREGDDIFNIYFINIEFQSYLATTVCPQFQSGLTAFILKASWCYSGELWGSDRAASQGGGGQSLLLFFFPHGHG